AALQAEAERGGVVAFDVDEGFVEACGLRACDGGGAVGKRTEVGEGDGGRSVVERILPDAVDAERSRDIGAVREVRVVLAEVAAVTEVEVIDERPAPGARPGERGIHAVAGGGVDETEGLGDGTVTA